MQPSRHAFHHLFSRKTLLQLREFRDFASQRLLVISYDQLRRHVELVDRSCDLLICDEGHRLRSQATATTKTLGQMRCRRRVLLSGTPLQNDLEAGRRQVFNSMFHAANSDFPSILLILHHFFHMFPL